MVREFISLADLSKAQVLDIHKIVKIVIVSKHKNFIFAAFYVLVPIFKNLNDNWEFFVIGFIASLS